MDGTDAEITADNVNLKPKKTPQDAQLLLRACRFAQEAHKGQKDHSGKEYYRSHLVPVCDMLEITGANCIIQAAGVLHDTIEDTDVTYEDLKKEFGDTVADLVLMNTHEGTKNEKGYYFPNLHPQFRGPEMYQWAVMIRFADRLSNISRMQPWDEKRRAQFLRRSIFWRIEV